MRNTFRFLPALLAACVLPLALSARADDAVTLTRSLKEGTTAKYKSVTKIDANGMDVVLKRAEKITVKEIKADGQVTLVYTAGAGTLTMSGNDQDLPSEPPVTETFDKAGKMTGYKAENPDEQYFSVGIQNLLAISYHIILPDKPVKSGDTWETQVDNPVVKSKKITIKGTYLGTEKKDDVEMWKIKQTVEAATAEDGSKMTTEVTVYLDPKDGNEQKLTADVKGVPSNVVGVLNWKYEAVLTKDDADTKKAAAAK